jgi:hypothetical protein
MKKGTPFLIRNGVPFEIACEPGASEGTNSQKGWSMPFKLIFVSLSLLSSLAFAQPEQLMIQINGIKPDVRTCSVRGGACRLAHDCCGDMYCESGTCQGGSFCQPKGASCRGSYECCAGSYCDNTGACR